MATAKTLREIFVLFMTRHGYTRAQAVYEFDNVLTVNGRPVIESHYLTVSRVGAPFALNRKKRMDIFLTFENAQNHATFNA